jgi:hypothetical protein
MGDERKPDFITLKTEYDRLCREQGGPVDLDSRSSRAHKTSLSRACNTYPSQLVLPILVEYRPDDENFARRHWPWAALAIDLYVSEQKEYADEPTPKEIEELLSQIAQLAKTLREQLNRLQELSYRGSNPTSPFRRGHLAWLDTFISQGIAGILSNDVASNPNLQERLLAARLEFIKTLAILDATARSASARVDRKLLNRERGQEIAGLSNFVFRCGEIWKSLTDRNPSANKVSRRGGQEDPDFVVFMRKLAALGPALLPTRRQVEICLRSKG